MAEFQESETSVGVDSKPKWSLKTVFWTLLSFVFVSAVLVLLLVKKDLWIEIEIITAVVAALMFLFYWWVLYHGIVFRDDEHIAFSLLPFEGTGDIGVGFGDITASGADDPVSVVLAFFIDLFVCFILAILLSVMFWLGVNAVLAAIILISAPLFYFFRSSVSFVLRNSPRCNGDLLRSAGLSAKYTLIKTIWFFLVVAGSHYMRVWWQGGH